jgi:FHIPEP family protein
MTGIAEPTSSRMSRQWHEFLRSQGPLADDVTLAGPRRSRKISDTHDEYVRLGEVFVRADPARRRTLDLLCVALIERRSEGYERPRPPEVVVLSTETIRSRTTAVPSGLRAADLLIGRGGADLRSVSLVLFAVERRPYVLNVVDSIEGLGQVIDYENDAEGSTAVGETIARRVDSLSCAPGVNIVIAAEIKRSGYVPEDPHHLLVPAGSDTTEMRELRVDDDGRVVTDGGSSSAPWQERDFVLVSFGRPPSRQSEVRSIRELRQEHALADVGLRPGVMTDEESWTARAARMRQTAKAQQVVARAIAGEAETARALFRSAARGPDADGFIEALAARIRTSHEYWLLDAALEVPTGDPRADEDAIARARERLVGRLEQLLGLPAPPVGDSTYLPMTTPIVVEVGYRLAEIVQSKPDGRDVFEEVIPEMKARTLAATGVALPGIRMRPNDSFAAGTFEIQIDETPLLQDAVTLDVRYRVVPYLGRPENPTGEMTNLDPHTGRSGAWLLIPEDTETAEDDAAAATGDGRLTTTAYLLHRIDVALRSQLARFLGLPEVEALLELWRSSDQAGLVAETVPDRRARLRLTWLLQSLVAESVSVSDSRAILSAVKDAGGLEQPVPALVRQVRLALRDHLPGRSDAMRRITVPPELEQAVATDASSDYSPSLVLAQWLRRTVNVHGPVICLVARTPEARERIALLARLEHPFIATLSSDELGATP